MKEIAKLITNENASQTALTKHFILILIVFLIFLTSITLAFVKSYESIYGQANQARVTELI